MIEWSVASGQKITGSMNVVFHSGEGTHARVGPDLTCAAMHAAISTRLVDRASSREVRFVTGDAYGHMCLCSAGDGNRGDAIEGRVDDQVAIFASNGNGREVVCLATSANREWAALVTSVGSVAVCKIGFAVHDGGKVEMDVVCRGGTRVDRINFSGDGDLVISGNCDSPVTICRRQHEGTWRESRSLEHESSVTVVIV